MPLHVLPFGFTQQLAAGVAVQAASTKSLDQAGKSRCSRYSRYFGLKEICEACTRTRRAASLGVGVDRTGALAAGPAACSEFQLFRHSSPHCPPAVAAAAKSTVPASSARCRGPPLNHRSKRGLINRPPRSTSCRLVSNPTLTIASPRRRIAMTRSGLIL